MRNKVREIRAAKGITQVQLARQAGVSRQTIHAIETSKHDPSVTLALKIAKVLRTSVEKLF